MEEFTKAVCYLITGFVIGVIITDYKHRCDSFTKDTLSIDSVINIRDSIKLKVEQLDSIKNAKVIEVSTLDNDSTLKLFYKLVQE